MYFLLLAVAASFLPSVWSSITLTDQHLGPNQILVLNTHTNIILCPGSSCSFHPTSIIRITTTANDEAVTVRLAPPSNSHQQYGTVEIGALCTLQVQTESSSPPPSPPPPSPPPSQGGTTLTISNLNVKQQGTLLVDKTTTHLIVQELQMEEVPRVNAGHIIVDNGAILTVKSSGMTSVAGLLDLRQAGSQFNVMGDITFASSSTVIWECSGSDAVRICGRIFVSGSAYMSGTANITVDTIKHPIVARVDAEVAMESLLSTVDRNGKFDRVVIDSVLRCAGATTSWSWSDFTLQVSTRCTDICRSENTCPPASRGPVLTPSSYLAAMDNEGADEEDGDENEDENGEVDKNEDESGAVTWAVVGLLVVACVGVVWFKRRGKYSNPRIPIPLGDDGNGVTELPPYHDK